MWLWLWIICVLCGSDHLTVAQVVENSPSDLNHRPSDRRFDPRPLQSTCQRVLEQDTTAIGVSACVCEWLMAGGTLQGSHYHQCMLTRIVKHFEWSS